MTWKFTPSHPALYLEHSSPSLHRGLTSLTLTSVHLSLLKKGSPDHQALHTPTRPYLIISRVSIFSWNFNFSKSVFFLLCLISWSPLDQILKGDQMWETRETSWPVGVCAFFEREKWTPKSFSWPQLQLPLGLCVGLLESQRPFPVIHLAVTFWACLGPPADSNIVLSLKQIIFPQMD